MSKKRTRSGSKSDYDDDESSSCSNSASLPTNQQADDVTNRQEELLEYVKITKFAFAPTKGSIESAGFDLHSPYEYVVPPRSPTSTGEMLIPTDLTFKFPAGCYGRVAPRSGMAAKFQIDVLGGVIDRDFRGNLSVVLINHGLAPYTIYPGDRIAQLICERISYPKLIERQSLDTSETERGSNGFGSTGI